MTYEYRISQWINGKMQQKEGLLIANTSREASFNVSEKINLKATKSIIVIKPSETVKVDET